MQCKDSGRRRPQTQALHCGAKADASAACALPDHHPLRPSQQQPGAPASANAMKASTSAGSYSTTTCAQGRRGRSGGQRGRRGGRRRGAGGARHMPLSQPRRLCSTAVQLLRRAAAAAFSSSTLNQALAAAARRAFCGGGSERSPEHEQWLQRAGARLQAPAGAPGARRWARRLLKRAAGRAYHPPSPAAPRQGSAAAGARSPAAARHARAAGCCAAGWAAATAGEQPCRTRAWARSCAAHLIVFCAGEGCAGHRHWRRSWPCCPPRVAPAAPSGCSLIAYQSRTGRHACRMPCPLPPLPCILALCTYSGASCVTN